MGLVQLFRVLEHRISESCQLADAQYLSDDGPLGTPGYVSDCCWPDPHHYVLNLDRLGRPEVAHWLYSSEQIFLGFEGELHPTYTAYSSQLYLERCTVLEWGAALRSVYHCDLAFFRTHEEYIRRIYANDHSRVRRLCGLLVHFNAIPVAQAGKVQDSIPHYLHLVQYWHACMDDLGVSSGERRWATLGNRPTATKRIALELFVADYGWNQSIARRPSSRNYERV